MFSHLAKLLEEHGITPQALEADEHVILAEPGNLVGGPQGVLTLTNRKFSFHPRQVEGPAEPHHSVDIPLGEISVVQLKKAMIGSTEYLVVGIPGRTPEYAVARAPAWVDAIERLKRGEMVAPMQPTTPQPVTVQREFALRL